MSDITAIRRSPGFILRRQTVASPKNPGPDDTSELGSSPIAGFPAVTLPSKKDEQGEGNSGREQTTLEARATREGPATHIVDKLAAIATPVAAPKPSRKPTSVSSTSAESQRLLAQVGVLLTHSASAASLEPLLQALLPHTSSMGSLRGISATHVVNLMTAVAATISQLKTNPQTKRIFRSLHKQLTQLTAIAKSSQNNVQETWEAPPAALCAWFALHDSNPKRQMTSTLAEYPFGRDGFPMDARDQPICPGTDFAKLVGARVGGTPPKKFSVVFETALRNALARLQDGISRQIIQMGFKANYIWGITIYVNKKVIDPVIYAHLAKQITVNSTGNATTLKGSAALWPPKVTFSPRRAPAVATAA